jgi:hypothetical protein
VPQLEPVVAPSVGAVRPGAQLSPFACPGVRIRAVRTGSRGALPANARARVSALKHPNDDVVVGQVIVPNGRRPEEVFAPAPLSEDGWFVMQAPSPGTPIWFILPGYEPIGYAALGAGDVFLDAVTFKPLSESGELEVRVSSPGSGVDVALTPRPCEPGLPSAAMLHEQRSAFTLRGLPPIPWHVVARAPGSTTASVDVTPTNARTSVELRLEPARVVSFERVTAARHDLCRAAVEQGQAIAGEPVLDAFVLKQKNRRVSFDRSLAPMAGFVGSGALSAYCRDPKVTSNFGERDVRTGDVYAIFAGDLITLIRFTAQ